MSTAATATQSKVIDAISAAMPRMDPAEQRIVTATYGLLAEGRPVPVEAVAEAAGLPVARVEQMLGSWPGVYRDGGGQVIGFWGLTVTRLEPEYRFLTGGKTCYTWCALDTLFIPGFLGKQVAVEATCPVTGEKIALTVGPDGVSELTPSGAVVSMLIPDRPFGYDVIESFCHRVLFFANSDAGASWTARHEGTTLLSVEEAFEVGRAVSERIAPDLYGAREVSR
jgi:alkylmercury lyase